jgi:hypothetical protein
MRTGSFRTAAFTVIVLTGVTAAAAPRALAERPPALDELASNDTPSPLGDMLQRLRDSLGPATPGTAPAAPPATTPAAPVRDESGRGDATRSGAAQPIVGFPEPDGLAITGRTGHLPPSEQLTGREAALRFRFQQQIHSGDRPWLPRVQPY